MANNIKVFFATNRILETDKNGRVKKSWAPPGEKRFTGLAKGGFRIGTSQVGIIERQTDRGEKINNEAKYKTATLVGGSGSAGGRPDKDTRKRVYDALVRSLGGGSLDTDSNKSKRSILAFVPGFNYKFSESIERGALLAQVYGSETHAFVPFVFSWPSIGQLSEGAYLRDRKNAEMSGKSMAGALKLFIDYITGLRRDDSCPGSVVLVAHSMGAHALLHAVQSMTIDPGAARPAFDRLILAAADVDDDALEKKGKLRPLETLANHVVVYVNSDDGPLHMATKLLGGSKRFGCNGPSRRTVETFSAKLDTIGCSDVDFGLHEQGQFGHQYYRISPFVVSDIKNVLDGKRPDKIARREPVASRQNVYRLVRPKRRRPSHQRQGSAARGRGSR